MLNHKTLQAIAQQRGVTAAQVALAWLLHQPDVIVIPKSSRLEHLQQNYAAGDLRLTAKELVTLDAVFPAPTQPRPLEVL